MTKIKQKEIQNYCKEHSNQDSLLLTELEKYTWNNEDIPQMISGQLVGKLLQSIIIMLGAKRIIEVGTFTGYSALQMAEAIPNNGEIHTCELMDIHVKTARSFFDQSKHGSKITIHQGPAIQSLENMLSGTFDMAFIDADKSNYLEYYQRTMILIRNGGVIVLDNMLWSGNVLDPEDDDSKALRKTGDYIQQDDRVFNILLSIRDGLMLCIKK